MIIIMIIKDIDNFIVKLNVLWSWWKI